MNIDTYLQATHKNLMDELVALEHELREETLVQALVCDIPALSVQDEQLPHLPPMTVTTSTGEDALELALRHYRDFYAEPYEPDDQTRPSTKFTGRLPGLICVHARNPKHYTLRVARINALKDEFKQLAHQLAPDDAYARFERLRELFPWLIQLQLTRHIHLMERPIKSAWFNWEHRYHVRNYSKQQALAMAEHRHTKATESALVTPQRQQELLELCQTIRDLPEHSRFSVRRPMKGMPVMKLNLEDKTPDEPQIRAFIAHSPCLAIQQIAPVKVTPLLDYVPPTSRQISERYELLDKELYLYCVQDT